MAKQTIIRITGQSFTNSNGWVFFGIQSMQFNELIENESWHIRKKSNQYWGMYYDKVTLILIYAYNLNKDSKAPHRNQ